MSAVAEKKTKAEPENPYAEFGAIKVASSALHRLTPLLGRREDSIWHANTRRTLWGWRVEPCAEGGVLVIATNGTAIGVIHDPTGHANKPATILATKGLRKAVKPPKPRRVYYPGDYDDMDLPADFQPCSVMATSLFVSVHSVASCAEPAEGEASPTDDWEAYSLYTEGAEEGSVWAGGYRLMAEYVDWRRVFTGWSPSKTTPGHQRLSANLFSAFCNISKDTLEIAMPADMAAPVLVQYARSPEFVGAIMRGRMDLHPPAAPAIPTWLAAS